MQDLLMIENSTMGYCTFLGEKLVTWRSKKQNVVARSSAKAEFKAMALGVCELLWLKIILERSKGCVGRTYETLLC